MVPGSFVYHVMVGTSQRELVKLSLVTEYCKDTGLYFKKWSCLVDSALELAAKPYKKDGCALATPFRTASITISDLYRMIIDDSFHDFEANYTETAFGLWRNFRNDPDYIQHFNASVCNTIALPPRRKNLSLGKLSEGQRARLATFGIAVLFFVDSLVTLLMTLMFGCAWV